MNRFIYTYICIYIYLTKALVRPSFSLDKFSSSTIRSLLLFASSFDASFSVIEAGGEVFFGEDIGE